MTAGKLNERVKIEQPIITRDSYGANIKTWQPVATVWANVRFERGAEFQRNRADLRTVSVSVRLRLCQKTRDMTADWRIIHRGRVFAVSAVLPDETNKQFIDVVCIEQRGDGE